MPTYVPFPLQPVQLVRLILSAVIHKHVLFLRPICPFFFYSSPPLFPILLYTSLSNNSIWGTLPDNIADFKSLEFLDISYKLFSSSLPLGIGKLGSLQNLSLAENNFSWLFQKWPPSSPSTWLAWEYASRKFGLINYSRTWKVS